MIEVSKISGEHFMVNAEAIDLIETIPDTLITLASGKKSWCWRSRPKL